MHRFLGFALFLAFALACSVSESPMTALDDSSLALAGGSGSVNGSGHFDRTMDTGTYRNVTFNAQTKKGVVSGKITVVNRIDPEETLDPDDPSTQVTTIDVTCFTIVGNKAVLAGTVTRDDLDPSRVGDEGALTVEDNGQGANAPAPDRISLVPISDPGFAQFRCNGPFFSPVFDVENGNVTIRP